MSRIPSRARPLAVGVVGLGAIGRRVCQALDDGLPGVTLAAATARDRARGEAFLKSLGIKLLEVPYNGAGPATTALLGGEVEILPVTVASIAGLVRAGKLKALAATQKSRVPLLPDVPTMPELGYPDIVMGQWNGVFGPAALPRSIVLKLHKAITSTMKQEPTIQRLNTAAAEAVFSQSPEEYATYVRGEHTRWGKIIRESGLAAK